MNIKIGRLTIHNKEQFDLGIFPLICLHWESSDRNSNIRIFYLNRPSVVWWRIRFAFHAVIALRCSPFFGWDMAKADSEGWMADGYSPKEAFWEELTYWRD